MAKTSSERRTLLAAALVLASLGSGCTQLDNALASVPFFAFMRNSQAIDPYEAPRPAPPGSVPYESPVGEVLPPMEGSEAALNAFAATARGTNPLAANDPAALALGKVMFERHCSVCHGVDGRGNGPVTDATGPGKFPAGLVPNLMAGSALGRADGYLYGIVRAGRGLMPSYGARTTHVERWAIVTYLNQLQSAATTQVAPAAPAPAGAAAPAGTQAAPAPADTSSPQEDR